MTLDMDFANQADMFHTAMCTSQSHLLSNWLVPLRRKVICFLNAGFALGQFGIGHCRMSLRTQAFTIRVDSSGS